jgi:DNA-binding NtrC family response regulator
MENLVERAYIIINTRVLTPSIFPAELFCKNRKDELRQAKVTLCLTEARRLAVEDFERLYLESLLAQHHGRIGVSAEAAGITTRQLNKLMSRHKIRKETFKS